MISSAEAAVSFGYSAACESTVSSCAGIGSCRRHVRRRRRGARNEAVCAVALHPCLYVGRRDRNEAVCAGFPLACVDRCSRWRQRRHDRAARGGQGMGDWLLMLVAGSIAGRHGQITYI